MRYIWFVTSIVYEFKRVAKENTISHFVCVVFGQINSLIFETMTYNVHVEISRTSQQVKIEYPSCNYVKSKFVMRYLVSSTVVVQLFNLFINSTKFPTLFSLLILTLIPSLISKLNSANSLISAHLLQVMVCRLELKL